MKEIDWDKSGVFKTRALPVHIFRAGDVMRILRVEKWRLEKYLTGKQYRLSPSGHLGKGHGSWRLFSRQDLYRLGVANQLVEDGFTAKFVSFVLQAIEDSQLLELDEHGEANVSDMGIFRTPKGPIVEFMGTRRSANSSIELYYVLHLQRLIKQIDSRILSVMKGE